MDCRPLEVIIDSAKGLKDVNPFSKMDVYAVVSVADDHRNRKQKTKTPVVKDGGTNPKWNSYPIKFTVDEAALLNKRLTLNIKLVSESTLGDTKIGKVKILLNELLYMGGGDAQKKQIKHVSYSVRSSNGKFRGTINFGYKFSVPEPQKKFHEPGMAYPVGHPGSSSGCPPAQAYPYPPPPPPQVGYGYPPQPGYGYPPQPGYGYPPQPRYGYPPQPGYRYPPQPGCPPAQAYPYLPPPQAGYGYPPQPGYGYPPQPGYGYPPQPGYGYPPQPWYGYQPQPGYGYPPQQVVQPQKPNMALVLGVELLCRLLIGSIIGVV